ncbi:MAG TPA: molybdopterin-dependent oxidoreductase [Gemmatimonadales bacterium]|nr:molybdopterin-dependent oxidoreductase [Gemmatimonadales bacterium]
MTDRIPSLTRRDFFRLGAVAGPASIVAACGWDGGPILEPRLRAFSRINDWVGEKVLFSPRRMAREYPVAARTSMQNFPAYSITYNRTGSFPVLGDLRDWRLEIGGLVKNPVRLSLQALETLPRLTYTVKHHCVEGWTAIATWTGVPLSTVVALVQPKPEARYLRFDSFDSGYYNGWDLTSAMHPQTILAYAYNDRPLGMNHGAPLRLYSPVKLGYKLTKYLSGLAFTRDRPGGYWEDQGYPWFGGV